MKIKKIHAIFPEGESFVLDREITTSDYIFIHYHTPVKANTVHGMVETEGHSFIVHSKHFHQKFTTNGTSLLHDWLHIDGNLDDIMKKANLEYNTLYEITTWDFISSILQEIEVEHLSNDCFSDDIKEGKMRELLLRLSRIVHGIPTQEVDEAVKQQFMEARSHIHQRYHQHWEIESMADIVHLAPSQFFYLYKKIFDISPKKDLQNVRIEHAKHKLLRQNLSVKEVAERIGYENEYYFIRKFKEITGKTPGQYKKSHQ